VQGFNPAAPAPPARAAAPVAQLVPEQQVAQLQQQVVTILDQAGKAEQPRQPAPAASGHASPARLQQSPGMGSGRMASSKTTDTRLDHMVSLCVCFPCGSAYVRACMCVQMIVHTCVRTWAHALTA